MSITQFYEEVLGANLANSRWSWGAVDPVTNRVYLRVWKDEIESRKDGERVLVLRRPPRHKSNGFPERCRHLEAIRGGAQGFGIVCVVRYSGDSDDRKIGDFNRDELLLFDGLEGKQNIYAKIAARVPISELARHRTAHSTLTRDIKSILARRKLDATTKEALVNARVGQGLFRSSVLKLWNDQCAVTGCRTLDAIRASHIKPWRDSTDDERLDPLNGLPLLATLDALFDAGLISFGDSGEMLVSSTLPRKERASLGVVGKRLVETPPDDMTSYLAYHRSEVYRDDAKS